VSYKKYVCAVLWLVMCVGGICDDCDSDNAGDQPSDCTSCQVWDCEAGGCVDKCPPPADLDPCMRWDCENCVPVERCPPPDDLDPCMDWDCVNCVPVERCPPPDDLDPCVDWDCVNCDPIDLCEDERGIYHVSLDAYNAIGELSDGYEMLCDAEHEFSQEFEIKKMALAFKFVEFSLTLPTMVPLPNGIALCQAIIDAMENEINRALIQAILDNVEYSYGNYSRAYESMERFETRMEFATTQLNIAVNLLHSCCDEFDNTPLQWPMEECPTHVDEE